MKKITQRQRQNIDTKLKITRIAADLFTTKGFTKVTIRDICESSEVSIGTFYHHFKSKDEIVNTGYHQLDILWEERIDGYQSKGTREDILFLLGEGGVLSQNTGWVLTSQSYMHLISSKIKYILSKDRSIHHHLQGIVKNGLGKDIDLKGTDIDQFIETLMRCTRGVIFDWCLHEGSYDLEKQLKNDLSRILDYYRY